MKFSILAAAGILSAASQVAAVEIITPWADTVWTAGAKGDITWKTTTADAGLKCNIQMMNGDYKNSNMVAQVSNPETPLDCTVGKFQIYPLNDFAKGEYWIRIGQASPENWAYSAPFKFEGNGTSKPFSVVGITNPSTAASGAAATSKAAAATSTTSAGSKALASASVDADKAESTDSAAAAISMSTAGVALGAIAAIAFAL